MIGIVFLVLLFTGIACKKRNEVAQKAGVFQPGMESIEINEHTKGVIYYIFAPGISYLLPF